MKLSPTSLSIRLASGTAMVALAFAAPSYAQETKDDGNAIDALTSEIVVTAQKKKDVENVQDVPVAITAFNGATLEALQVRDLGSLSYSAPNVSLDQIGTTRGVANFSIRGLGINSSIPSIDPTVGVFVDGVYLGVNNGVSFDVFDLDSIELLRGPQGILFGRNTTGGAVLVNTGNPTDDLRVKGKIAYDGPIDKGRGSGNLTVQGTVSGPIITDILNFKLGAYHNRDRGYFQNLFDGSDHGKANTLILRGALELTPTDGIRILAKGEIFDSKGDGPAAQNHGIYDRNSFDFSIDNRGLYDTRAEFATLRAEFDIGDNGKVTNIFGYRDYRAVTDADIDSRPQFLFHSGTALSQKQYSNELRYAGSYGPLDITVGGFWFTQDVKYDENRDIPPSSPLTFYGGGKQDHDVLGVFAAADFDITDALTLNAGIRWSKEEKNAAVTYTRPRPACSVVDGTCPTTGTNPFIPTENNGFTDGNVWKNWAPKLGLTFDATDDILLYSNWARGYRSGGYNFRITAPIAFEAITTANGSFAFDEEKVDNFEAGLKLQSSDRKATMNLAVFMTKIDDMQREVNQSSGTSGVAQSIFNTANAEIFGVEAEGRYALTDNLLFTGNVGFIDADYKKILFDISGDGAINNTDLGLKLPRVPKLTWGIGAVYDLNLGNSGSLVTRLNFQHRDRNAYTDNNYGWLNASDQLDGSIAWKTNNWLTVSLYGKNLLDEVQHGGDTQIPFGGVLSDGTNVAFEERPAAGTFSPLSKGRVVGLEASISF